MSNYVPPRRPSPYAPILAAQPVTPPTPPTEPDMTAADIRRYVNELADEYLFGALKRFHDEVVLERDRPKDSIIPAANGADMWTGDVTTGGANGYFCRSYISEYLIARDAGKNPLDASVAGFEAAKASYQRAVGIVAPQPPVSSAPFRAPISAEGREFVAPETGA
jgi:hypothetical protein